MLEKKALHASERESDRVRRLRLTWFFQRSMFANRRVWFLDETGVNLSLARKYAPAIGGSRASGNVPKNYGQGVTILGVINGSGELASLEVRDATDELVMLAFINEILSGILLPGDCLVMDNLRSHKTRSVQAAVAVSAC